MRRFEFDQHLAPYNLSAYQQWQSLASFISKSCIARLSPLPSGNISITAEADPALLRPVTAAEQKLYTQLQEGRPQAGQLRVAVELTGTLCHSQQKLQLKHADEPAAVPHLLCTLWCTHLTEGRYQAGSAAASVCMSLVCLWVHWGICG